VEVTEETLRARRATSPRPTADRVRSYCEAALRRAVAAVRGAADGERNATLNREALSVLRLAAGEHLDADRVREELHAAALAVGLDASEINSTLASAWRAAQAQPRNPPAPTQRAQPRAAHESWLAPSAPGIERHPCTDAGNAERFRDDHGDRFRYCHTWACWLVWDGRRWVRDTDGAASRAMLASARKFHRVALDIENQDVRTAVCTWALKSESTDKVAAALKTAQSLGGLALTADKLDADPWVLNVLNGTLDLRTGELRPHRYEDLITKLAPVQYDPAARSDLFDRFLTEATGGNGELAAFLQRFVGYTLTGDTSEERFAFVHGPKGSCKTTFVEALRAILGDYATSANFETFCRQREGRTGSGASDDLARLAGARFVSAVETAGSSRLDEGVINRYTGGDTVAARHLYAGTFEFRPQFKLWLISNHDPKVPDDPDDGIWRRMARTPFTYRPAKPNPKVKATLCDPALSGPAILAWAAWGCAAWRQDGLCVPQSVEDATEAYRARNDPCAGFWADRCRFDPNFTVLRRDLRAAYEAWHADTGTGHPLSPREFAIRLRTRLVATHGTAWKPDTTVRVDGVKDPQRAWAGLALVVT
jgi:putative DNA primase/helicase